MKNGVVTNGEAHGFSPEKKSSMVVMFLATKVVEWAPRNPPTLAFAKAGAAPGTTGGLDPVFLEPLPRRGSSLSCTFATPTLQANAITRPQQWLKASPRPQQWLVLGVQGCRLTGFKPLKPLKCLAGRLPA